MTTRPYEPVAYAEMGNGKLKWYCPLHKHGDFAQNPYCYDAQTEINGWLHLMTHDDEDLARVFGMRRLYVWYCILACVAAKKNHDKFFKEAMTNEYHKGITFENRFEITVRVLKLGMKNLFLNADKWVKHTANKELY